jgi:hypothetical protein
MAIVKKCAKGHPIKGDNVAWYSYRGARAKRCRTCYNQYMKLYQRRVRRGASRTAAKRRAKKR